MLSFFTRLKSKSSSIDEDPRLEQQSLKTLMLFDFFRENRRLTVQEFAEVEISKTGTTAGHKLGKRKVG